MDGVKALSKDIFIMMAFINLQVNMFDYIKMLKLFYK